VTATRVLVLSAGNGAASNLMRSLQAVPGIDVIGANADRFVLKKSPAPRNYLLPATDHPAFAAALLGVVAKEAVDLVLPGHDDDARMLSDLRAALGSRVFLPSAELIDLCQDKYRATVALRERGVPAPRTEAIGTLDDIEPIFARLGSPPRLWCRLRTGSGSRGAIPVAGGGPARGGVG
jgi:carbamoylphosphate synthase large subunit